MDEVITQRNTASHERVTDLDCKAPGQGFLGGGGSVMQRGCNAARVETQWPSKLEASLDQRETPMLGVEKCSRIVIIERRPLIRECLFLCFKASSRYEVVALPDVESWMEIAGDSPGCLILLCTERGPKHPEVRRHLSLLLHSGRSAVVLLHDPEDADSVVDALELGVRGYIPTSIPIEIAVQAIRLVEVGGVFVPASSLLESRKLAESPVFAEGANGEQFTSRQAAVIEALRKGKPNKIIAYELGMRDVI